jgi:hypothetical protein
MPILSAQFREILYRQHRSIVALWAMFLLAVGFYFLVPEIVSECRFHPAADSENEPVRNALWIAAVLTTAVLLWVKSRFHNVRAVFQAARQLTDTQDFAGHTPAEKNASRLVYFYRTRMLFAFCLAELVALFGLILVFIGNYTSDQQWLSLLSAGLLVYVYPSRGFFEGLINEYDRQGVRRI